MSGLPKEIPFTKTPHYLHELMADLSGGEYKVLSFISRKTHGFHKEKDKIALSQFEDFTGLARNTVLKAIKSLRDKGIIKRYKDTIPHSYSIIVPNHNSTKPDKHDETAHSCGSDNEPQEVQKVNHAPVQKLNPQKKLKKESERNTTSSSDFSDELWQVINYWNKVFPNTLNPDDSGITKYIEEALDQFSAQQIKQAITMRSSCRYYRDHKPQLLDKPTAFFPYPDTIKNDLERKSQGMYDYDEMIDKVTSSDLTTDDFEMIGDSKLWMLNKQKGRVTMKT